MGDEPRDRRLDFRSVEPHLQFLPFGVAALAVGFGDAERIVGGGQLGLRGLQRRFTLLDRRDGHHAAAELLRASKIVARPLRLRFRLGDRAARLLDRCVRAFDGRVVLSEQRVELGSIEAREDLAGLDQSPSSASSSTMESPSIRAPTIASSRATKVPETNRRSTNSRRSAGATLTAGGGGAAGCSAAAASAGHDAALSGANFARSAGGSAQGAKALAAQTPPSAASATAAMTSRERRI